MHGQRSLPGRLRSPAPESNLFILVKISATRRRSLWRFLSITPERVRAKFTNSLGHRLRCGGEGVTLATRHEEHAQTFAFQADLAGWQWTTDHLRIPVAIVLAGLLWTIVIAFLSVVASVWVRWRMAATGLFLAIFFVGSGMGEAWAAILDTPLGRLTNLNLLLNVVWYQLFGVTPGSPRVGDIPASLAWGVLVGVALVALFLLDRRLRAREVVR